MSSKKFLNEWSILVVPVPVQCLLCRENESKEEKTTISMMTTTLKLNLGHPMILCPRFTCLITFAPSSITVTTLTHQHASSSSSPNLRRTHTHSPTLVRSHNSHPFQEPNDLVEDLRVPDHWLVPTTALQVLSFQSQIGIIFEYKIQYKITNWDGPASCVVVVVVVFTYQESEWLRVTLHKWLDDEYCPEETNVEISRVAANSYYNCLLQKETELGEILLRMARELESISYKESFHGAFSSANAAVNLIAQRIEQSCPPNWNLIAPHMVWFGLVWSSPLNRIEQFCHPILFLS